MVLDFGGIINLRLVLNDLSGNLSIVTMLSYSLRLALRTLPASG